MRPGPPKKPSALRLLEGDTSHRPQNKREPKPALLKKALAAPDWLTREGRSVWKRVVPELQRLNLLSKLDLDALGAYCASVGRARKAEAILKRGGLTVKVNGQVQRRIEIGIARDSWKDARAFAGELGLTPAARTRLEVPLNPSEAGADGDEEAIDREIFGT